MSPAISNLLLTQDNTKEPKADRYARSKCMITPMDLAKLVSKHFVALAQLSLDNPYEVNLTLAQYFLVDVAKETIRLNNIVVGRACDLAKMAARTSKPVASVIRAVWHRIVQNNRNRSSSSCDNLHAVEAAVVHEREQLKIRDPFAAGEEGEPDVKTEPVVKTEASGDAGPAVAPAEASSAKEEMKADPDQDPGQGELQLVSTNVFQKKGLVYHTNGGKLEEVALHAGPDGFWWAISSDAKKIPQLCPVLLRVRGSLQDRQQLRQKMPSWRVLLMVLQGMKRRARSHE